MKKITTSELVNKVFAFCEAYSGVNFFPYQAQFAKRIIYSILENDGEEITALFSRQCLHGNTRVTTTDGNRAIKDIRIGDTVFGFDFDGLTESKVTAAYSAGKQELFLVKLNNGKKIKATQNHRFLDYHQKLYKPLYQFTPGDEIAYYATDGRIKRSGIKSITSVGRQTVYDIEVEGAESFVTQNGFILHNSGKSETVATIAGGLAILMPTLAHKPMFADDVRLQQFKNGVLIGIFAPALHQAQISFNRLKERMFSKHSLMIMDDPDIQVGLDTNNGQNVTLTNGSVITCMSASEGSNIEGKSYMMIIIDEAQDVSNFKYTKSIFPMGAFYNSTYILIGTPNTSKGFFYHSIERNKREYMNGNGRKNHFEYGYKTVLKYNPRYGKHIEGALRKLGEDSDEFQMSYNLKWILERGMFVNPGFDKLGQVHLGTVLVDQQKKHTVGIDCGKNNDSTVITVVEVDYDNPVIIEAAKDMHTPDYITYNTTIKAWLELVGDNYEEQYPDVMAFISNYNVVRIAIDATGSGSPIADRVAANVDCEVIPYVFGTQSKSILYKHFDTEIKSGRFQYPADPETQETREYYRFMEQMEELQKSYSGQYMVVSHPPERGKHDDYPDSAALAVYAAKGEDVSKPQNERSPFKEHKNAAHVFYVSRNKFTARRR